MKNFLMKPTGFFNILHPSCKGEKITNVRLGLQAEKSAIAPQI
jgi:hypothetical protein